MAEIVAHPQLPRGTQRLVTRELSGLATVDPGTRARVQVLARHLTMLSRLDGFERLESLVPELERLVELSELVGRDPSRVAVFHRQLSILRVRFDAFRLAGPPSPPSRRPGFEGREVVVLPRT
jgi:hypothetical protein